VEEGSVMHRTSAWFRAGEAAGEAAAERRSRGLPSLSREESWQVATGTTRPTLRRWQQFQDGWVTGFCRTSSAPVTASEVQDADMAIRRCFAREPNGQPCGREAVLVVGSPEATVCVSHAWSALLRSEPLDSVQPTETEEMSRYRPVCPYVRYRMVRQIRQPH
jgi:hypothetical protein